MLATDTDSGIFEHPLPEYMVGPELGKMKLEKTFSDGYFLAPKVYGYFVEYSIKPSEIGKHKVIAKGVGSKLSYADLESLYKTGLPVNVSKDIWVKDISNYKIKVITRDISISGEFTKREKVFNAKGQWVDTRPLVVKDGVVVSTENSKIKNISLDLIYKDYSLKEIEAPNYKLLLAPKNLNKGPSQSKDRLITGAKNNISNKDVTNINSLINKLKELDIKIEKLNSELKDYKPNSFNFKMIQTQLTIVVQNRGAVLRELFILGIKDPYSYILEKENISACSSSSGYLFKWSKENKLFSFTGSKL
jgi:hypothetical protein